MIRTMIGASGLAVLWLLMSGLWDKPLILAFGVLSVALSIWIGKRIDTADGEQMNYALKPLSTLRYLMWLLVEIAKSNI